MLKALLIFSIKEKFMLNPLLHIPGCSLYDSFSQIMKSLFFANNSKITN